MSPKTNSTEFKECLRISALIFVVFVALVTILGKGGEGEGNGITGGNGNGGGSATDNQLFDANGDGRADVLIETAADPMPWRFGVSTGEEFETDNSLAQTFDAGAYRDGKAIAVADADGDGTGDVLVQLKSVGGSTEWKVFLSNGVSSTETIGNISMPTGDGAKALAFTDVDADGMADIFIQQQVNGFSEFYISWGSGNAYSAPEFIYSFNTGLGRIDLIALEDINSDGTADLVFESSSGGSHCYFVRTFENGVFERQPLGTDCWQTEDDFDLIESSPDGIGEGGTQQTQRFEAVGVADLNGDGKSELVFSDSWNFLRTVRISSTPGAIQFRTSGQALTSWHYLSFVDGPSGTEWENNSHSFGVLENSPTSVSSSYTQMPPTTVGLADLNDDGHADLVYELSSFDAVVQQTTLSLIALVSDGDGGFDQQTWLENELVGPITNADIGLGDFNGDDRPDVLVNSGGDFGDYSVVYLNDRRQFVSEFDNLWYAEFDGTRFRVLYPEGDGLTSIAHDTGSLIAWAGTNDTLLYTSNEFKDLMKDKGFDLKTGMQGNAGPILPGQCQTVYANADNKDLSAEFGTLVCLDIDGITLRQQMIYGGCDLANQGGLGGIGGQCEIGTFKTDVGIEIAGVDQNLGVEGPRAGACSALSVEFSCVRAGAQLASVSGKTMIGDTGVGAGVSLGFGGGASFGADDGVLSGVIDLQLGIGLSIEFSIDYEATGEFILNHGEDAYVFIRDDVGETVVSAGEAIIDAVNIINDTGGVVVDGVGEGITFIGNTVTTIGDEVVDFVNDGIDAVTGFFDGLF